MTMGERFHFSFTPSLLPSEALEALFVQKEDLAERIVTLTFDSVATDAKYHFLLVGPRGIGKTHTVSLIYHRVKAKYPNPDQLLIAWLREDSWGIASFLDLLIQILQTLQKEYGDEELRLRTEELFQLAPKQAEQAAAVLLTEYVGTRTLFLIVENLDGLFEGLGDMGQKRLRAYLQENPFCTILATSPSLFNGVSLQTSPFYGFFTAHHLVDFDFDNALDFLIKIARYKKDRSLTAFLRTPQGRARVRAVHHLAGGNPRVYTIFAQFLNRASMEKLVEPFMRAMDDLTPYYQARMSLLSPQQRKIIELLCDLRGAITVKEISQRCFITHQTASGQLKLLREMRYVNATAIGRESYYELNEPLMRICLEVKKHRGEPLRLFVEFLRCWYTKPELESLLEMMPVEAKIESQYIRQALTLSKEGTDDPRISSCMMDFARYEKAGAYDKALQVLDELDALGPVNSVNMVKRGDIYLELDQPGKALSIFRQAIAIDGTSVPAWMGAGFSCVESNQYEEGLHAFDKTLELGGDFSGTWGLRGVCLQELGQHEQAVHSFKKLIEHDPNDVGGWDFMGKSLQELSRFDEAAEAFAKVYALDNNNHEALVKRYISLFQAGKIEEAMEVGKKHDATLSKYSIYLGTKALILSIQGMDGEALLCWQQVIDKGDKSSFIHLGKIGSLIALQRWDDADAALNKALTRYPDSKSPREFGCGQIINKLFSTKQDADFWNQGTHLFVSRFAEHKALSSLAAGLTQSIAKFMQKTVSDQTAEMWRDAWVNTASGYPEMELPLRLLDTAIKYRINNDQRLLMELPIEERKILEEIIEKAEIKPE
jgi:tetratricopeptide (TPR) repeat protein